ncbi:MAG: ATP-binding cassette domain-containing protein [Pyrinomonadaceae bacterium]
MMTDHIVAARGLTKIYDGRRAVDRIDFVVRRGETFGLLGPNGAGKSTIMRMIACCTPPTAEATRGLILTSGARCGECVL